MEEGLAGHRDGPPPGHAGQLFPWQLCDFGNQSERVPFDKLKMRRRKNISGNFHTGTGDRIWSPHLDGKQAAMFLPRSSAGHVSAEWAGRSQHLSLLFLKHKTCSKKEAEDICLKNYDSLPRSCLLCEKFIWDLFRSNDTTALGVRQFKFLFVLADLSISKSIYHFKAQKEV